MREVLRHRDVRLLLLGQVVSQAGDWLYGVALVVFVLDATGSAAWVAAVEVARLAPWIVVSPVAGLLADRVDRRRVLIAGDVVQLAAMLALAAVAAAGADPVVAVAVALVAATTQVVVSPSFQAAVPQLVDERGLASMNALLSAIMNLAIVVGPAVGAVLLFLGSPAVAFALNGITFAVSAACFALVRSPMGPVTAPAGETDEAEPGVDRQDTAGSARATGRAALGGALRVAAADLGAGVATIRGSGTARAIVLVMAGGLFAYGMQVVLWALLAADRTAAGTDSITLFYVANGIGGLVATVPASRARSGRAAMRIVAAGSVVGGASVAALAAGQGLVAFLALIAIQGLVISIVDIVAITQLQRAVGPAALGRAMGAMDSMTSVAMVGGTLLAPWLVASAGLDAALATGGIVLAGIGGIAALATRREPVVDAPIEARVRLLAGLALFADAPQFAVEGLAGACRELRVGPGTAVVTEGEAADALYVVVDGTLEVTQGPAGVRLTGLRGGDFFGEIGIVKGVPRTATVTTRSATTLLRIEAETFRCLIESGAAHHAVLGRSVGLRLARRTPAVDAVASRP